MRCNLEINRSSTPERIFHKIVKEMAQPVGIVLFGPDCDFKNSVSRSCVKRIPGLAVGYGVNASLALRDTGRPLKDGRSVMVTMLGKASGYRSERARLVRTLRDLGAKTVIGLYVEVKRPPSCASIADYQTLDGQIQRLLSHPPMASEFDYLLIAREMTQVIWSGLTGQIGRIALRLADEIPDVDIVSGISRLTDDGTDLLINDIAAGRDRLNGIGRYGLSDLAWYSYADLASLANSPRNFDVVVDFSNAEVFNQVLHFAVKARVPLICETSGLSSQQLELLKNATSQIPIFRDGNFRFKVKKFIDDVVKTAENLNGEQLSLYENLPQGTPYPSEVANAIVSKVGATTGKTVKLFSSGHLPADRPDSNWHLDVGGEPCASLHCSIEGYNDLVRDVLEIAKVMKKQPVRAGQIYDLDTIWDEIPYSAKE